MDVYHRMLHYSTNTCKMLFLEFDIFLYLSVNSSCQSLVKNKIYAELQIIYIINCFVFIRSYMQKGINQSLQNSACCI